MAGEQNHIYVTLLSNSSQKLYPTSTLSAFTTRLAQPIDLVSTDRWEVGICEFSCHPTNTGTFESLQIVSASNAFIYCDLISLQFMGSKYVRYTDRDTTLTGELVPFKFSKVPTKIEPQFRRVSAW
jgi:hypothetical protein